MKLNGMLLSWYSCPCYTCHLINLSKSATNFSGYAHLPTIGKCLAWIEIWITWMDRRSGGVSGGEGPVFGLRIFLFGGLM